MKPLAGIARARQRLSGHRTTHSATAANTASEYPWRLTRRLASSGRLALFRAAATGDLGPGSYVIKAPRRDGDDIENALLRRETTVAESVRHPNLVSVLGAKFGERDIHIVLPYLEGVTLRQLISRRLLEVSLALSVVRQLASALAALHAAYWLHGQVRPEHVIASPQGQTTLIDLTQAPRLESSECDVQTGLPGTADRNVHLTYAAPERFSSRGRLTSAADTYSLGILLFESLAGEPPFVASSPRESMRAHQRAAAPDLRSYRAGLSLEIAELVRRMLAKEPLRRPSDEELVRWLAELEIEELAN